MEKLFLLALMLMTIIAYPIAALAEIVIGVAHITDRDDSGLVSNLTATEVLFCRWVFEIFPAR